MSDSAISLLMVEDSPSLAEVYRAYLEGTGHEIHIAANLKEAFAAYNANRPDVVLLDIQLPDGSGMDFLKRYGDAKNDAAIIVMTAHGTNEIALEAMDMGASDFLTKPFDASRLQVTLENAVAKLRLGKEVSVLSALERDGFSGFIGRSTAMQAVYKRIESLAASDATAFIAGESGTGKELAAEAIHNSSRRHSKELVAINCGAIPTELMESELFGHVKDSFTGAGSDRTGAVGAAEGGTLFLDEICELDLTLQKKLLRFIQTGTYRKVGCNKLQTANVRFICATNREPLEEMREGRFREDLFYRLYVVPVTLPPLREHREDIMQIADSFLAQFCAEENKSFSGFTLKAKEAMEQYLWPGNVRQLQNAIHQMVILYDDNLIEYSMLPDYVFTGDLKAGLLPDEDSVNDQHGESRNLTHSAVVPLWKIEKYTIESAISACEGNVNKAAGLLEVAPSTLYRKLRSWKENQNSAGTN